MHSPRFANGHRGCWLFLNGRETLQDFTYFRLARTRRNHSFIKQDLRTLRDYKRAEGCIGCNTSIGLRWKCHKPDQLVFQSSRKYDWRYIHPNWCSNFGVLPQHWLNLSTEIVRRYMVKNSEDFVYELAARNSDHWHYNWLLVYKDDFFYRSMVIRL